MIPTAECVPLAFQDGLGASPALCLGIVCPTGPQLKVGPSRWNCVCVGGAGLSGPRPCDSSPPIELPLSFLLKYQSFGFEESLHTVDPRCPVSPEAKPLPCTARYPAEERRKTSTGWEEAGRAEQVHGDKEAAGVSCRKQSPRAKPGNQPEVAGGGTVETQRMSAATDPWGGQGGDPAGPQGRHISPACPLWPPQEKDGWDQGRTL